MSGAFNDPFPHAASYVVSALTLPFTLPVPARELILSNFPAGAVSITVQTVSGETVVIPLGTTAITTPPITLPIQVAAILAASPNTITITALWH